MWTCIGIGIGLVVGFVIGSNVGWILHKWSIRDYREEQREVKGPQGGYGDPIPMPRNNRTMWD